MRIFMIGGTGLLGSEAAKELIKRGHTVKSMALPPLPVGAVLDPKMEIELGDYSKLSDLELASKLKGFDGIIFAAGVDERIEAPAPIYDFFKKYNITPLERLLRIAKENGVKHAVVLGSYFSYFAKVRPNDKLTKWHPYIRSRIDQENMALSFSDCNFDVAILELPYIFGTQPGRKPVWVILIEQIRKMKKITLFPKGGTTMVTVRQVAEAIAGAIEINKGGVCYPIGYYNMTWRELLKITHNYMGMPNRKIITIPNFLFTLAGKSIKKKQQKVGIEGGINMAKFASLQCSNQFIDKSLGCDILKVKEDDIEKAIGDSIKLSMEVYDNKIDAITMKGE